MTLYVSNPSRQNAVFFYRQPNNLLAQVAIRSGQQVEIGQGWSPQDTEKVVQQIEAYGGRDASEAHGGLSRMTGLLYRVEFPVDEDEIRSAHKAVTAAAQDRSVTQATRAALGADRFVNEKIGGKRGGRVARTMNVTVEQELPPGERPTGDEVRFDLTIDPNGRSDINLPV